MSAHQDGWVTSYVYNGFGDLLTLQSPDTGTTTYQYDAAGRRWKTIPADGRTSEVTFDLLDRPTQVRAWYPGQGTWQYADYGYAASRVNTLQAKVGGTWRNVATGITYDAAGRMTALTHGNGIGRSVGYDWDGRVESIAGSIEKAL